MSKTRVADRYKLRDRNGRGVKAAKYRQHYRRHLRPYRLWVRRLVTRLKAAPCEDCGQRYPYYVMEFDHVRGVKKYNIGSMVYANYSVRLILEEIVKCDLVCANCHRLRTYGTGRLEEL